MSTRSSLVPPRDHEPAGWWLTATPAAAEAGGSFLYQRRRRPPLVAGLPAADPERSRAEAARRARGRVRRYCAANRLNRLGTLTYADACHDVHQFRADIAGFFRRLRAARGGKAFPYLWVPEWHPGGHGLHGHFAVGQFIPRGLIEAAWGHGFISIKLLSDLPVGSGTLEESRRAAGYLSKYVVKSFDDDRPKGLHRFDVAQDFQPERVRVYGRTSDEALAAAAALMGSSVPVRLWDSRAEPSWQGPPAVWASWAA